MRTSILLGMAMLNYHMEYSGPARSAIDMGYQHTTKKRRKPRKVKPDGKPEFKNRSKKGRP